MLMGGWWSRVVVFPFLPGSREPVGAVKPWRTSARSTASSESNVVKAGSGPFFPRTTRQSPSPLGSSTGPATSVPRSRALRDSGSWPAAIGTGGSPYIFGSSKAVSSWLTAFNTYGETRAARGRTATSRRGSTGRLPSTETCSVLQSLEQRLAEVVLHRANELAGTTVPFVRCHNDFSELNVYCGEIDQSSIGKAWDRASRRPSTTYRTGSSGPSDRQSGGDVRGLLDALPRPRGRRPISQRARASLGVYTAALELDDRLPPLLLAGEVRRRAVTIVCSARRRTGRASNRFARYVSILADQTDVLFERPYRWGLALYVGHTTSDADGARQRLERTLRPERPGYATTNATALGSVEGIVDAGRQMVRRAISRRGTSVDPRARSGGTRAARAFGTDVASSDVIDIDESNPDATIVADLSSRARSQRAPSIALSVQTLQFIFDTRGVLEEAHRVLAPGGVLLCTVPAVSRISMRYLDAEYWSFTVAGCRELTIAFPAQTLTCARTAMPACAAFLYGLAVEDLARAGTPGRGSVLPLVIAVKGSEASDGSTGR